MHTTLTRSLGIISFLTAFLATPAQAAPPPTAFGVWDRGSSYDPTDHPFLKGLAFTQRWSDLEKQPGAFDWSILDQAMDSAVRRNQFVYLSLNVGPDAPQWIYTKGVPRVECKEQIYDSWPVYPFYPSPEYKSLLQRLITEFGKHIRTYPNEKQQRIAFALRLATTPAAHRF